MNKNILIIRSVTKVGGPGRQVIATAKEFSRRGYNITFITGGGDMMDEVNNTNISIVVFPELMPERRRLVDLMRVTKKIQKIICQNDISFVYGLNSVSTLVAYFAGGRRRKNIVFLNTLVGSGKNWFHKKMPFCHTVCSENQREQLIEAGFSKKRLFVNYPATIDLNVYHPPKYSKAKLRKELDIPQTGIVIGAIMMNTKGSSSLWKVMNKLMDEYENLYFIFVGSSSKFQYNYDRIDKIEKKNRVKILGVRKDIPEVIAAMDIFSHLLDRTEYETFGMVMTEAMAMQKPVVASNIGGINNIIVDGESGYLVATDEQYYEKVRLLIEDNEKRDVMGKYARELCTEKFTIQKHVDRIERIRDYLEK